MSLENLDIQQRFKEKVDIKYLFMLQVNRCLHVAGTDYFPSNVTALWRMLPTMSYYRVEQRGDEWEIEEPTLFFRKNCGVRIGTQQSPVLFDEEQPVKRLEDGRIDWDDPNIMSPILKMHKTSDYDHLFRLVLQEAQDIGILWSEEGGGVINVPAVVAEYLKTSKKAPRTPLGRQPIQ